MTLSVLIKLSISSFNFTYHLLVVSNIWNLSNKKWKAYENLKNVKFYTYVYVWKKLKSIKKNPKLLLCQIYKYIFATVGLLPILRLNCSVISKTKALARLQHALKWMISLGIITSPDPKFSTSINIFPLNSNSKFYEIITYCL